MRLRNAVAQQLLFQDALNHITLRLPPYTLRWRRRPAACWAWSARWALACECSRNARGLRLEHALLLFSTLRFAFCFLVLHLLGALRCLHGSFGGFGCTAFTVSSLCLLSFSRDVVRMLFFNLGILPVLTTSRRSPTETSRLFFNVLEHGIDAFPRPASRRVRPCRTVMEAVTLFPEAIEKHVARFEPPELGASLLFRQYAVVVALAIPARAISSSRSATFVL